MHVTKGKTLAQSISDRTDYGLNPEKTNDGELTSAYACDPKSFAAEVLLSKRQYKHFTGKEEKNDVLVYQVRQSFKPGEVTPEEANQIGYNFASRFLKGKHAFFVCTHTDKAHMHNHIYWNAVTLDCKRKFRNFRNSSKAIARLSDLICTEHQLSVIHNPQRGSTAYNKWHGFKGTPSHREVLRIAIDEALEQRPTTSMRSFRSLPSKASKSKTERILLLSMRTLSRISVCTPWAMGIPRMLSVPSSKVREFISPRNAELCGIRTDRKASLIFKLSLLPVWVRAIAVHCLPSMFANLSLTFSSPFPKDNFQ